MKMNWNIKGKRLAVLIAAAMWQPDAYEHVGARGDIVNKNALEHSPAQ